MRGMRLPILFGSLIVVAAARPHPSPPEPKTSSPAIAQAVRISLPFTGMGSASFPLECGSLSLMGR